MHISLCLHYKELGELKSLKQFLLLFGKITIKVYIYIRWSRLGGPQGYIIHDVAEIVYP